MKLADFRCLRFLPVRIAILPIQLHGLLMIARDLLTVLEDVSGSMCLDPGPLNDHALKLRAVLGSPRKVQAFVVPLINEVIVPSVLGYHIDISSCYSGERFPCAFTGFPLDE